MTKIFAAALGGLPAYLFLGALDFSMAAGATKALNANNLAAAPVVAAAPAPRVVPVQRIEIVGTRIRADAAALLAAKR